MFRTALYLATLITFAVEVFNPSTPFVREYIFKSDRPGNILSISHYISSEVSTKSKTDSVQILEQTRIKKIIENDAQCGYSYAASKFQISIPNYPKIKKVSLLEQFKNRFPTVLLRPHIV